MVTTKKSKTKKKTSSKSKIKRTKTVPTKTKKKKKVVKVKKNNKEIMVKLLPVVLIVVGLVLNLYVYLDVITPEYTTYPNQFKNSVELKIPQLDIKLRKWSLNAKLNALDSISINTYRTFYKITSPDLYQTVVTNLQNLQIFDTRTNKTETIRFDNAVLYIGDNFFTTAKDYFILTFSNSRYSLVLFGSITVSESGTKIKFIITPITGYISYIDGTKEYLYFSEDKLYAVPKYSEVPSDIKSMITNDFNLVDPSTREIIRL